jgi:hypothetical protein
MSEKPEPDEPPASTRDEADGAPTAHLSDTQPSRTLPAAALRALAEAEERRRAAREAEKPLPPAEVGGRAGPDPVRFGDWEKDGLASDF